MSKMDVFLKKHHVRVPVELEFDLDPPSKHEGLNLFFGLVGIDIEEADAKSLLKELIEEAVEKKLCEAWKHDYLDDLKEIEL